MNRILSVAAIAATLLAVGCATKNTNITDVNQPPVNQTGISGTISHDTIWHQGTGGVSILDDIIIDGATVTVDSGTIVTLSGNAKISIINSGKLDIKKHVTFRMDQHSYIDVGNSNSAGTISATGTVTDSIFFVPSGSSPWGYQYLPFGGIYINSTATSTKLAFCAISGANVGVFVESNARVDITDCSIRNSTSDGIVFQSNASAIDSTAFARNTIKGNGGYGIDIYANSVTDISGTVKIAGNTTGGIHVNGEIVGHTSTWKKLDAPYIISGFVSIHDATGPVLTIDPGVTLMFDANAYIGIGSNSEAGTLVAQGTAADSIKFRPKANTRWGYQYAPFGGLYFDDKATAQCIVKYCAIDSANAGIYLTDNVTIELTNCNIYGSLHSGVICGTGAGFADTTKFANNRISQNGAYAVETTPPFIGAIAASNKVTGNTSGGVMIDDGTVAENAYWNKLDVPYTVKGIISIQGPTGPTLTIAPGTTLLFDVNTYVQIGSSSQAGTLIAQGTVTDSIKFRPTANARWGYQYAPYGGLYFKSKATALSSVKYCVIDSANSGIHLETDVQIELTNSNIYGSLYSGVVCEDGAGFADTTKFANNRISQNILYAIDIAPDYVASIAGNNTIAGNTGGGVKVRAGNVLANSLWKKLDAFYDVYGQVQIGSPSGAELTIEPGTTLRFAVNAYIEIGPNTQPGALIANGTATKRISFINLAAGSRWGYQYANYGGLYFNNDATISSVSYATIDYANGGIYMDVPVTVDHCTITNYNQYGIGYGATGLNGLVSTGTNTISSSSGVTEKTF